LRYDDAQKRVVVETLETPQELRVFSFVTLEKIIYNMESKLINHFFRQVKNLTLNFGLSILQLMVF
jgi:hypothetical protein